MSEIARTLTATRQFACLPRGPQYGGDGDWQGEHVGTNSANYAPARFT